MNTAESHRAVAARVRAAAPARGHSALDVSPKKRLAYCINCFPNYIEAMIYREVLALRSRGYDVVTFSIRKPLEAEVPEEARALAASTRYILPIRPSRLGAVHFRALLANPARYLATLVAVVGGTHERLRDRWRSFCHFAEAVVIAPEVQRLGIEHIHAHWAVGAATCAMVLSRLLDVPFTFTAHAYDIWLDRLLLPEKLRAADTIVTCTDYNRRHLIEAYGTPAEKLRVVYHGLDLERFQRRGRPANATPVILSVGRLVEQKGYEDLLYVCADLVRRGQAVTCAIIGDGPLRGRLERLVDELDLRGVVRLPGRLVGDGVLDWYTRADVFALFCIEAMAMELPVVSTRYSGVPELVVDGTTGLLAECGDRRALADALARVLARPELRATMGNAGRQRVIRDFATAACLTKLESVFGSGAGRSSIAS